MRSKSHPIRGLLAWTLLAGLFFGGCSDESRPLSPVPDVEQNLLPSDGVKLPNEPGTIAEEKCAAGPPPGLVTVFLGSRSLELWPYTGSSFDGTPMDPVNVIFAGPASPLEVRAALMSLDGDRTAFGLPDAYPFNAAWSDAIGDVQTAFAGEEGWTGNYVQLQLGVYDPVRAHLRLFETASPFGDGVWTVGAAHFEIMIPGTADHQVISWELAEQLVTVDLMRSGLLDGAVPIALSGVIHQAPTFREIPAVIYNGLPPELQQLVLGPGAPAQVSDPVGIPTDGQATIFQVATAVPVPAGAWDQTFTKTYLQVIPKPFCNDGSDYVLVEGPVTFSKNVEILRSGRYRCHSEYDGTLQVTPWDVINNQPAGPAYSARVAGAQNGALFHRRWATSAWDLRRADSTGGGELLLTSLYVDQGGPKKYCTWTRCND